MLCFASQLPPMLKKKRKFIEHHSQSTHNNKCSSTVQNIGAPIFLIDIFNIPGTLSSPASRQSSEDSGTTANQPTMWLGTEDGCIHVYNCLDNIRIKKNKVKLQHNSGVHSIV